jgi:NitT/TauT family transport system ATP-binding protein
MSVSIKIKNLSKVIQGKNILADFNLDIKAGSIVSIFGPNGTGKSTLLNILSGVDVDYKGIIEKECVGGTVKMSYVFQNYRDTLLNWRNGKDNIALPLEIKENNNIEELVADVEKRLKLKVDLNKYPYQCSGGQQQMISFMRALVTKPNLLLIDEPFSALDYENNLFLRDCLIEYYVKYKPTIILITHSVEEAVHLSHQIIVLSKAPTHVHEIIENKKPHPRSMDYIASPYFDELKNKLVKSFGSIIKK